MKKIALYICISLVVLLLLGSAFACTSDTRSINFSSDSYTVYLSGGNVSVTPSVTTRPKGNDYTLTISNPTIAKIDGTSVTGLKEGIATITATSGEHTDTATLVVKAVYDGEDDDYVNDGKFVVYFSTDYSAVPAQRVAPGEKATVPTAPLREGYTLFGWYTDPDFTTPYDFDTPVNSNVTLYALWSVSDPIFKFTNVNDAVYVSGFKYSYIPYESATLPATDDSGNVVTGVYAGAFKNNSKLQSVTIPDSYTKIFSSAFENCTALKSVTFGGAGLQVIEELAFSGCTELHTVEFGGEGLTTISNSAFFGCAKLVSINIPASVSKIGVSAFEGCKSLNLTKLPSSLKVIEMRSFAGTALTSIDLSSIEAIYNQAFWGATLLSTVKNPDSLVTVGSYAFGSLLSSEAGESTPWLRNTSETSKWGDKEGAKVTYLGNVLVYVSPVGIGTKPLPIYVKATTKTIAGQAFSDVENAMAYFIGATPPTYGTNAFGGMAEPTLDIVVPMGKTETYAKAWLITSTDEDGYYVPSAYSLALIERIYEFTTIYDPTLVGMTMYTRTPLKNYSTVAGESILYSKLNAAQANDPYAGISFSETEKNYVIHAYQGTATELDLNAMFTADAGTKTVTIDRICPYAFNVNDTLQKLILPARIKSIDDSAFMECYKLTELRLVGDGTFAPLSEHISQYSFSGLLDSLKIYVPSAQLEKYNTRWAVKCASLKNKFVGYAEEE